jgi:hypothetical protein
MKNEWLLYVALAGLSWGTYVPLIFFGGNELPTSKPGIGGRLMAILCVGVAYFVLAVIIPLALFLSKQAEWPTMKTTGLVFSSMAGVAGAIGAICVIFATKAAVSQATGSGLPKDTFRVFIAPLIFGLAPVINVLVSSIWHPSSEHPFHFEWKSPAWTLWLGIVLVGAGAALVLYSKEAAEVERSKQKPAVVAEKKP